MNVTPLGPFLETVSGLSREQFLSRWRAPALLIEPVGDVNASDLDGSTPFSMPSWWRPTPAYGRVTAGTTAASEPGTLASATRIVWLEKTVRNSFANLITLGRAPNNDVRFSLESVSKLHVTFNRSGDRWFVQDHSSRNGTFVNGERLEAGALRRLGDGDSIRFAPELRARFFAPAALLDFVAILKRFGGASAGA